MNGALYLLSLLLLLPLFAFAAFGALIDSPTAPLWDPFGRGLWLLGVGLYEPTRQDACIALPAWLAK